MTKNDFKKKYPYIKHINGRNVSEMSDYALTKVDAYFSKKYATMSAELDDIVEDTATIGYVCPICGTHMSEEEHLQYGCVNNVCVNCK